jgi:hypothetical protein
VHLLRWRRLVLALALIAVVAGIIVLVRSEEWTGPHGRPEPWSSPRVSVDGRRVTVAYSVGGCFGSERTETAEGRDEVTITVLVREHPDDTCSDLAQERTATVTLDEPLGDRDLVDGATD